MNLPEDAIGRLQMLPATSGDVATYDLARVGSFLTYCGYIALTLTVSAVALTVSWLAIWMFVRDRRTLLTVLAMLTAEIGVTVGMLF